MKIGERVYTPRFCTVTIDAMFSTEEEARRCGYTEPTYYKDENYIVLGRSTDLYSMDFAAVQKQSH